MFHYILFTYIKFTYRKKFCGTIGGTKLKWNLYHNNIAKYLKTIAYTEVKSLKPKD
ncbi:hypothetical protein MASR2M54_03090 [Aliarcobacter cryaerophilus]